MEDSDVWNFERLREEGFEGNILSALKSVTKLSEDEDYQQFIKRAAQNEIGRNVKIADIKDNLDVTRLKSISEKDVARLNKYKLALDKLYVENNFT